jgi:hypothetical protein
MTVYKKSMKSLQMIRKCTNGALSNLGVWLSKLAIICSFKLWIHHQTNDIQHADEEAVITNIDLANHDYNEEAEAVETDIRTVKEMLQSIHQ